MKRDKRFDAMRGKFAAFLKFWLLQGVSVAIIMTSATLAFGSQSFSLVWVGVLGLLTWLAGLCVETIADAQKYRFNQQPQNKNKWIDTGLWRYSRHPNYFGEILVWVGVYMYSTSFLSGIGLLVALVSPLFIAVLLLFASGIPLLEKSANAKWGQNKNYQKYRNRTAILIPWPRSK